MFAISTSKATQVSTNSLSASKMALEAQQYAAAEGDVIRMKAYTDLANSAKAPITGTHFSKEVSLGSESNYTDTIKKRIATVKIYKDSDSIPCYTLDVPRLSADVNGKGVPIGTVITWASANNPTENGVWLECNGQSCSSYPELVRVLGKNTVPDYRGRFLETDTTVGTVKEAALPNITGHFFAYDNGSIYTGMYDAGIFNGAFSKLQESYFHIYDKNSVITFEPHTGNAYSDVQKLYEYGASLGGQYLFADTEVWTDFSATRSSNVYQDGVTTVQPPSITVRRFIRAA